MTSVHELPRRQRQRAAAQATLPQQTRPAFEKVMPLPAWAASKGVSMTTVKRWKRSGRLQVTKLSANRVGVSESQDRAFMATCETA